MSGLDPTDEVLVEWIISAAKAIAVFAQSCLVAGVEDPDAHRQLVEVADLLEQAVERFD